MNKPEARPEIPLAEVKIDTKEAESFQNQTLRPIIKQLHSLLLEHFSVLLLSKKSEYFKISEDKKTNYIRSIFQKEIRYKSELKGIVIGNFTIQEFHKYISSSSSFDKRIYTIVEERILTNQNELIDHRK